MHPKQVVLHVVGATVFVLLGTMNAAGYRYGGGDHAYYVPAVYRAMDATLFPADRSLLAAQSDLMLFDELAGAAARVSGVALPVLFFAAYVSGLVLLYGAAHALGAALFQTPLAPWALVAALTLRHRITKTGANTLEGYLHPRLIAFALGVLGLAWFLRGRRRAALAAVLVSAALHPTTAFWFACWLVFSAGAGFSRPLVRLKADATSGANATSGADATSARNARLALAGAGLLAAALIAGPLHHRLVVMDDAWLRVLAQKDYLFPAKWPAYAWAINLAYPVVIAAIFRRRRAAGVATPDEARVVMGALALTALFLISVPFTAANVALAVQMQVTRVFWLLDLMAVAYVICLVEGVRPLVATGHPAKRGLTPYVLAALVAISAARGLYIMRYEHPERPLFALNLPDDEWADAMEWIRRTPVETNVLADPGHAFRYGTSVRVAAARDVYLEEVKDTALAIYSQPVALRVAERIGALGDFAGLTEERARALAARYGLTCLVTERLMMLPLLYENARFHVYALR